MRRCNVKTRSRAAGPPEFRLVHPTKKVRPWNQFPRVGTNLGFRAWNPHQGGGTMTRELHVYDHASGMIALLFVGPNGTVEAFDVEGFSRIGEFASVAEAAAFACADVEMPRLDS